MNEFTNELSLKTLSDCFYIGIGRKLALPQRGVGDTKKMIATVSRKLEAISAGLFDGASVESDSDKSMLQQMFLDAAKSLSFEHIVDAYDALNSTAVDHIEDRAQEIADAAYSEGLLNEKFELPRSPRRSIIKRHL